VSIAIAFVLHRAHKVVQPVIPGLEISSKIQGEIARSWKNCEILDFRKKKFNLWLEARKFHGILFPNFSINPIITVILIFLFSENICSAIAGITNFV